VPIITSFKLTASTPTGRWVIRFPTFVCHSTLLHSEAGVTNPSAGAGAYEAPGIVKADGVYYLIVSGKTGWRSNPNKVFWSNSISGPWTGGSDIAPQAQNTYNSQNTFELTVQGSQKTTYIYMGDAWDSKGGASSNYVWLPMNINSG
jgi:beta-xylosidase